MPPPDQIQKDGLTDFVGAVTDGLYGAVAFDFKSPHDPISAKKAWFFFDKEYVCLGTDINSRSNLHVVTTLNQCLLQGKVIVSNESNETVVSKGEHHTDQVKWIYHDGIGYIFPNPAKISLSNQVQTGSWYKINKQSDSPKDTVNLEVFKLWLDHGSRPVNAGYEYIVVPAVTEQEMNSAGTRNVEILSNTTLIQAVRHSRLQICQAVFYKAGELKISDKLKITCDHPGIVMIKTDGEKIMQISLADPNRELGRFHFSVSARFEMVGDNFNAVWNETKGTTEISADLPQGAYAGKSVTIKL
jgi:chondroitin AC lyase